MTIGQVATQLGLNVQTIRFYEREGLLPKLERSSSGYRQFNAEVVKRILFIRHAQEVGFSLREISTLLSLRADPEGSCDTVRQFTSEKIEQLNMRLKNLRKMKKTLQNLAEMCRSGLPVSSCPILDALEDVQNDQAKVLT